MFMLDKVGYTTNIFIEFDLNKANSKKLYVLCDEISTHEFQSFLFPFATTISVYSHE